MTDTDTHSASISALPPRLTRLTFHGPLSEARAQGLVRRLAGTDPRTVLDIGCGWGELMLRVLAAAPQATGVGVDLNADDLARGRRNAEARGLAERARFVEESARGTSRGPADLVLCVGSSHALGAAEPPGHFAEALRELRRLVSDDGRVLLGEGFWQRPPTAAELAGMWPGAAASDHHDLAALLDLVVAAGFRPEWTETANLDEWEEFESAYQADVEVWLARNPGHPLADETRERLDRHRAQWMSYRGVLGLAYLTLVPAL
ncbi:MULTISPECIES: SAM-dependent methyltransferase [Streptomyces]|uniref:SAM-dependent methyltransferase n=1 Tax=Streptomyces TaxID=1883 RepID=UPI000565535B|nr:MULTISPECIES: class I SAM-dependent methyltransferase [unclassified Streptomyces]SEC84496.1 Methyltransferase domain-containing protein [Streptomyces sp. PAN_FS17]SEC89686.1 Methyltransferase domain-containing protein [Streptomyces sp. KS_5]